MKHRIKKILRLIPVVILTLLLITLLHEVGHLIVALLAGARITEFNIFLHDAHISYDGGNFTPFMGMWCDANGALFPLFVSYIYALFFRKKSKNFFYRFFSFLFCFVTSTSLIIWVYTPVLYLAGIRYMKDDGFKFVDKFIMYHHPLFISVAALLLMGVGALLMVKKGLFRAYWDTLVEIKGK